MAFDVIPSREPNVRPAIWRRTARRAERESGTTLGRPVLDWRTARRPSLRFTSSTSSRTSSPRRSLHDHNNSTMALSRFVKAFRRAPRWSASVAVGWGRCSSTTRGTAFHHGNVTSPAPRPTGRMPGSPGRLSPYRHVRSRRHPRLRRAEVRFRALREEQSKSCDVVVDCPGSLPGQLPVEPELLQQTQVH